MSKKSFQQVGKSNNTVPVLFSKAKGLFPPAAKDFFVVAVSIPIREKLFLFQVINIPLLLFLFYI